MSGYGRTTILVTIGTKHLTVDYFDHYIVSRGWTNKVTAEKIGVSTSTVARWRDGEGAPNWRTMRALQRYYRKEL